MLILCIKNISKDDTNSIFIQLLNKLFLKTFINNFEIFMFGGIVSLRYIYFPFHNCFYDKHIRSISYFGFGV